MLTHKGKKKRHTDWMSNEWIKERGWNRRRQCEGDKWKEKKIPGLLEEGVFPKHWSERGGWVVEWQLSSCCPFAVLSVTGQC